MHDYRLVLALAFLLSTASACGKSADVREPTAPSLPTTPAAPGLQLSKSSIVLDATVGSDLPQTAAIDVAGERNAAVAGLVVRTVDYAAGAPNGWLVASLSASTTPATLQLVAQPSRMSAGTYKATVSLAGAGGAAATLDVAIRLAPPAQNARIVFSPTEIQLDLIEGDSTGRDVSAQVDADSVPVVPELELGTIRFGESAAQWLSAALSATATPARISLHATATALTPGVYTARIPVGSSAVPSASTALVVSLLVRTRAQCPPTPRPLALGDSAGGTLDEGRCFSAQWQYYDLYEVAAPPGTRVDISLNSVAFDPVLEAVASDGKVIARNDDESDSSWNSRLLIDAPASGVLLVRVTTFWDLETGSYELRAQRAVR